MKRAFLAAALIIVSSVAFADATSVLLDPEKVLSMSAEEYATAVRNAPDVNVRNKNGMTPLHWMAFVGTAANIYALTQAGADVNARDTTKGWTALHWAAASGTPDSIYVLTQAGADVNARDPNGQTALHWAAASGTPDSIVALVTAGADVKARDKFRQTALHVAVEFGTPDNIVALLEVGASGSVKDDDGKTPFDLAEDNDRVKGTAAYWALNDAQYK